MSVLLFTGAASVLTRRWSSTVADAPLPRARFDIPLPEPIEPLGFGGPTISPDGRQIVFSAFVGGKRQLLIRSLESAVPRRLPGTEGGSNPFWSPDSRTVGFFADGKLKKIDAAGVQPVVTLCNGNGRGAWGTDGVIVFSNGPIYRIADTGGIPEAVTTLDASRGEISHGVVGFLSDGRRFIFNDSLNRRATSYVVSLSSPSERHRLDLPGGSQGVLSVTISNDRLFYNKRGTITVQTLDAKTLELGSPVALADGWSPPTASRTGTIVFGTSGYPTTQLTWIDRAGRRLSTVGPPDTFLSVELSPTASRAAVVRGGPWIYDMDLWLADVTTGVFTPLTNHPGMEADSVWSPDGRRIAYTSDQNGHRLPFVKDVITGREDRLVDVPGELVVDDWTPDGRSVIVRDMGRSVFAVPTTTAAKLTLLTDAPLQKDQSQVSPDGHWIAFQSVESDEINVYAAEFPSFSRVRQVSIAGGSQPRWRGDAKELFYIAADMTMMAVEFSNGIFASPRPLFKASRPPFDGISQYDVTADGQRFLMVEPRQPASYMFTFLLNWLPAEPK